MSDVELWCVVSRLGASILALLCVFVMSATSPDPTITVTPCACGSGATTPVAISASRIGLCSPRFTATLKLRTQSTAAL